MKFIQILVVIITLLLPRSCETEISPEQADSFIKLLGSYGVDRAKGVVVLKNGGYAIAGTTEELNGSSRMVMMVTDQYGNMVSGFPKYYTEDTLSSGANAILTRDGGESGFLLCGYLKKAEDNLDIYVVHVWNDGRVIWSRSYGSEGNESVIHAAQALETTTLPHEKPEYVLAGYQETNGTKDIMVMLLDENGDSIALSLNYSKPVNSKEASANYILNTGESYLCVCTYNKFVGEGTDILVLNFDDELSPNDVILGDKSSDEYGKCIVQDDQDRYIVLGNRINTQTGDSEISLHVVDTDGLLFEDPITLTPISERDADLNAERLVKIKSNRFAIVGTRRAGDSKDIFIQFLQDYQGSNRTIIGSSGDQTGTDISVPDEGGLILIGDNEYEGTSIISLIRTDDSGNL